MNRESRPSSSRGSSYSHFAVLVGAFVVAVASTAPSCTAATFASPSGHAASDAIVTLLIDEEGIDNGKSPNFFSDVEVNDDIAELAVRSQLPFFAANVGSFITLHTGQVGDEGWFALQTIPDSWFAAGPTDDGLRNFVGDPSLPFPHDVGPGLGTEDAHGDREALLDKIPDVMPLRAEALRLLEGRTVCAVVYDGNISTNYNPLNGSLKGAKLGTVAFEVISVARSTELSSSSLPEVGIHILDAEEVCGGELTLFLDAADPSVVRLGLEQSSPNPANTVMAIAFTLTEAGRATLRVFDVHGRLIRTLADGSYERGRHVVGWDRLDASGRAVTSGVYYYRIEALGETRSRNLLMLK